MRYLCTWLIFVAATLWALAIVGAPHLHVSAPSDERAHVEARTAGAPLTLAAATLTVVYLTGSAVCHQRPERSFHAAGVQYPVCARCTGLYIAAPFGLLAMLLRRPPHAPYPPRLPHADRTGRDAGADASGDADAAYRRWRMILLGAAVPTVVSIGLERLGGPSDTISRALTALPLGAAVAAFVAAVLLGHFAFAPKCTASPRARV